jgi:hypothetical protein
MNLIILSNGSMRTERCSVSKIALRYLPAGIIGFYLSSTFVLAGGYRMSPVINPFG